MGNYISEKILHVQRISKNKSESLYYALANAKNIKKEQEITVLYFVDDSSLCFIENRFYTSMEAYEEYKRVFNTGAAHARSGSTIPQLQKAMIEEWKNDMELYRAFWLGYKSHHLDISRTVEQIIK